MTAPQSETAGVASADRFEGLTKDAASIADTSFRGNPGDRIEAIKRQLAQRGYTLHVLHDGSFFVARWNLLKTLPDLHALVHFVRQITGGSQ